MGRGPKPTKGKAKPAVSRQSPKSDDGRVRDLEKRLAEAQEQLRTRDTELVQARQQLKVAHVQATESLEQQAATSEILRVIAGSPTDPQPVFDAILKRAATLCEAQLAHLWLYEGGEQFRLGAGYGSRPDHLQWLQQGLHRFGQPFFRESGPWRVGQVLDVRDTEPYRRGEPVWIRTADHEGMRTLLGVPLVKDGRLVGSIAVYRREVQPFTDQQTALVQTFADQAVIAIENVRLFNETKEALERQTATSEILRVISSSPTDVQPVFEGVLASGVRLCGASFGGVFRFDGELIHLVTSHEWPAEQLKAVYRRFPMPPGDGSLAARAIRDRAVVQTPDYVADSRAGVLPEWVPQGEQRPRSTIAIPMLREGSALGAIVLARAEPGLFPDEQVALLQTFADQAVIAIENVRLFTELQEKNRALTQAHAQVTESLEQQTATAEILRVIASSPTDVQPVLEAVVQNASRLCGTSNVSLYQVEGSRMRKVAEHGLPLTALSVGETRPISRTSVSGRAIVDRTTIHLPDHQSADAAREYPDARRDTGIRTTIGVPLLREGIAIGVFTAYRTESRPFAEHEIALLKTFADQAAIAIENVRLFKELEARTAALTRSVGELRALGAVGQALSSTLDVDVVLDTIVTRANDLIGADGCTIFEYDELTEQFHLRATRNLEPRLVELARGTPLRKGDQGILGQLPMERQAVQVPDITAGSYSSPISDALIEAGYRAVVAVPLIREEHLIGALTMNRKTPGEFPHETIELLQTFATQSALAIQNARLFHEIADKSRQLEVASQHKSEFLANMSHELRTPLNAIIGFSEVLAERMFGELNEKQVEYLKDIHASGQHLLSLINDILDLSKIEAGKMELELSDFDLPMTIDNALMLVRERAARRGIDLHRTVDERLGQVQADERKIRQVLLNLLSNAIKFTPEGGRIDVHAIPRDGMVDVSVSDTGVGIAPEDQEAVFEEFRQVGTADKKVEGTGLGLALSRKFIELHGGKIWVKSQVGEGSTFTFTIPASQGE